MAVVAFVLAVESKVQIVRNSTRREKKTGEVWWSPWV